MKRASSNKLQQLQAWIKGINIAMLTTEDRHGHLRSRPMVVLDDTPEDALWFVSEASSHKVDDIHGHHAVNVSYADPATNRYVSVAGRARVVRDRLRLKTLWTAKLVEWFPKGCEDEELVLVRVEVHEAEAWQSGARELEVELVVGSKPASEHEVLTFA